MAKEGRRTIPGDSRLTDTEKRLVAMVALLESPAPWTGRGHREDATRLAELDQWLSEHAPAVRLALDQARSTESNRARRGAE
ncbi:MAG: hypothetical protein OXI15_02320 [Chromatiales bacterium]|nr:hypothetical protein [Chromatiales bacterium]